MTQNPDTLFDTLATIQADKRLPPVDKWHPQRQGRIDIRISADGTWYHEGLPIRRHEIVKLFSTVLRKDSDGFWLVTPAEQLAIVVDDAPFLAVDFESKGHARSADLIFVTNVDDYVVADADHRIRVASADGQPRPYIHVRSGLDALINRAAFYRLAELATLEGSEYCVYSRGQRFTLGDA
jgi:hypothetical protein